MNVAIVGSRTYTKLQHVIDYVYSLPPDTVIVSGGARGVDKTAEEAAKKRGMPTPLIFLPDWATHGKAAGYLRNKDIVEAADVVVAFWDGQSRGTAHSMKLALDMGKTLYVKLPYQDIVLIHAA